LLKLQKSLGKVWHPANFSPKINLCQPD